MSSVDAFAVVVAIVCFAAIIGALTWYLLDQR